MEILWEEGDGNDADAFARFLVETAENVARAYRETGEPITQAEKRAVAEIRAAVRSLPHPA
jgi:hypothetical protein